MGSHWREWLRHSLIDIVPDWGGGFKREHQGAEGQQM